MLSCQTTGLLCICDYQILVSKLQLHAMSFFTAHCFTQDYIFRVNNSQFTSWSMKYSICVPIQLTISKMGRVCNGPSHNKNHKWNLHTLTHTLLLMVMNINIVAVGMQNLTVCKLEITGSCKTFAPNNITKCHLITDHAQEIRTKCNSRCVCDQTRAWNSELSRPDAALVS